MQKIIWYSYVPYSYSCDRYKLFVFLSIDTFPANTQYIYEKILLSKNLITLLP